MSNLKQVAEKLSQPVVPRSHRRRGISHVLYCRARFLAEFILSVRPPVGGSIAPETSVCLYAESTTYVKFLESIDEQKINDLAQKSGSCSSFSDMGLACRGAWHAPWGGRRPPLRSQSVIRSAVQRSEESLHGSDSQNTKILRSLRRVGTEVWPRLWNSVRPFAIAVTH